MKHRREQGTGGGNSRSESNARQELAKVALAKRNRLSFGGVGPQVLTFITISIGMSKTSRFTVQQYAHSTFPSLNPN